MIDFKTTIGFGAPTKAGTNKVHGSPRFAGALRRVADRLDPPRAHNLSSPSSDPC
jgi:transketolase